MSSTFNDVLRGVASHISSVTNIPTIVTRKKAVFLPSDNLPLCIVTYGGGEKIGVETMGAPGSTDWQYPVQVSLLYHGDRSFSLDDTSQAVREGVRQALYVPVISFGTGGSLHTIDVDLEASRPIEYQGHEDTNFDVMTMVVTYQVFQDRAA